MQRKKIIRQEDITWLNTIFSKIFSWHLCDRQWRELGERTCSFKAAHGVVSARTIPQLVTTGTHWFCDMVCVHCRPSWYNYNRLAEGFTRDVWLHPKINMWCMNFIERQGMVRFEVFPVQCMMHEILLKIHWMPEFFFTKKIVGGKIV